jgi:glycosyltransferase involved in cell wall biosynthesis
LQALQSRGFHVAAAGSGRGNEFAEAGIPFFPYRLNRWIGVLDDRRSRSELRRLFADHRPDIVNAFDTKPGLLVPRAARQAGTSAVVRTITGMGYAHSVDSLVGLVLRRTYDLLQRRASRISDMIIFQNADDQQHFLSRRLVAGEKQILIPSSGLDTARFHGSRTPGLNRKTTRAQLGADSQSVVVLMVARLVRNKGVLEFFEAARRVCALRPNSVFWLVGPADSEGKQAVPLADLDAHADVVRYLGPRSDVVDLMAAADVFVLPSYYREGVPRVLLEAAATGLPIVTTDLPGCHDVVTDNWNGILVPPKDTPAIVRAVLRLLDDENLRTEMGSKGPDVVNLRFTLASVADAYASVYRSVLAGRTRSRQV